MDFGEYVAGRSVAIVGPAVPTHDQSAVIDAHDVVVRVGWLRPEPLHAWYGVKTDVAFFNTGWSRLVSGSGLVDEHLATLDWVLVKRDYGMTSATACRQVTLPDGVNANQIPILLHDLSQFEPGPVSVFGADFYWDPALVYGDGYLQVVAEVKPRDAQKSVPDLLNGHDWHLQRGVCREAMRRLNVVGDDRFLNVMGLSDVEYRDGMLASYPGLTC